jgi:ABC-type branched-subunit amino acid transport system ATPase component
VPWARALDRRLRPRARAPHSRVRRTPRPATPRPNPADGARLEADALTKRYGALAALDGVTVALAAGSVSALVGPNGSGKTTALRLLAGTQRPDTGTVLLDGRDVTSLPTSARVELGVVRTLQAAGSFRELTALEHVLAGSALRRGYAGPLRAVTRTPLARAEEREATERALDVLAFLELEAAADVRAGELSGFEQRLLMLAAALGTEPRVLLLDEPAAGAAATDLPRLARIVESIHERGITILLVEHDLRLVRSVAGRVLVLDAGRLIADGSPREVSREPAVRAAYLGRRSLA